MKLIKYCNEDYNIKNPKCESIQIGTLNYYRNSPNKFISDSKEGIITKVEISNRKKEIKLTKDLCQLLTPMINYRGSEKYYMTLGHGGKATFKMKTTFPNWYVFSCSMESIKAQESTQKDLGYDSSFELKFGKEFNNIVGQYLINYLTRKLGSNIRVRAPNEPIKYVENDTVIFHTAPFFDDFLFLKSDKFSNQKEYRFLWILTDNEDHIIDVPDEPILIPLTTELKNCFK